MEVEHLTVGLDWHFIQSHVSCDVILSKFIESPGWLKILNSSNISTHKQVIFNSGLIMQDGKPLACQAYVQLLGNKSTKH